MTKSVKAEIEKLMEIGTGDEIHFTDGSIWCCNLLQWTESDPGYVIFCPCSFEEIRQGNQPDKYYFPSELKSLLIDAVKGGAKIEQGVGLVSDEDGEFGHCDQCGSQCDSEGCTRNRKHEFAIEG
jgi:hypothetical protein